MKRLLALILLFGCVQPGIQRPNQRNYVIEVPGLSLVDSRSFAASEVFSSDSCFNHSSVILYYSDTGIDAPEQANYVVQLFFNESRASCLDGFFQDEGLFHRVNLTEQYAWFFSDGLVIVEGTFGALGSEEYNETLLLTLVLGYQGFLE